MKKLSLNEKAVVRSVKALLDKADKLLLSIGDDDNEYLNDASGFIEDVLESLEGALDDENYDGEDE